MNKRRIRTLRLILGGDERNTFEVREGDVVTIGRDPGCVVQITHKTVSPVHCRIEFKDEAFVVTDLDSAAGVTSGGKRFKQYPLSGRTDLMIGAIALTCLEGSALVSPEGLADSPDAGGPGQTPGVRVSADGTVRGPEIVRTGPINGKDFTVIRLTPAFIASLFVHLVVLALVYDLPYLRFAAFNSDKILMDVQPYPETPLLENDMNSEELEFDEPPLFPDDLVEVVDDWLEEDTPESNEPLDTLRIDPGVIGIMGSGAGAGWAQTARLAGLGGLSAGTRNYIESLRSRGIDVVFVIDSTSSMERFIIEAKTVVDKMISSLVAIVPNLRLSIVTYRDKGDEFVTHALEFTTDRYEILNFLEVLDAEGGGDLEEAIYDGLNRAIRHLFWRPQSRKVVFLIGDCGYHPEDERRLDRLLAEFRKEGGVVNAICVTDSDPSNSTEKSVQEMFDRIAQATGGECVRLEEYDKVIRTFVNLAFANRFEPDVAGLVEKAQISRASQYIDRKARQGDRDWLLKNVKKHPVHPRLVEAILNGPDREELGILVDYLETESVSTETRWASLYILRRALRRPFQYDPNIPVMDQKAHLLFIRKAVSEYPVKENGKTVEKAPQELWTGRDGTHADFK